MEMAITITWREVVLISAFAVLVYLGGMLVGMIRARERAGGVDSSGKIRTDIEALRARVASLEKARGDPVEPEAAAEESLYSHAQRLIQEGFPADEVADRLALSRAEIDLLAALQREQGTTASRTPAD